MRLSDAVIGYGVAGFIVFGLMLPLVAFTGFGGSDLSESVEGEFKAMSAAMDDASIASYNAALSVGQAEDALRAVAEAEGSVRDTLSDSSDTLALASSLSGDVASGFSAVHGSLSLLGVTQFEGVSVKFTALSESLSNASESMAEVSSHVSTASDELDETADYLESNADDMRKLSADFEEMSAQLDRVSTKFTRDLWIVSNTRLLMVLGLVYLMSVHLALTVCGLELRKMG